MVQSTVFATGNAVLFLVVAVALWTCPGHKFWFEGYLIDDWLQVLRHVADKVE